jgi:retron-type reverse transcriptase
VVDADIQAFFDEIEPDVLMKLVERRICDRRLLNT